MTDVTGKKSDKRWRILPNLPDDVFTAWKKIQGALNPSSVVATVDEDGSPRTAPYGSMRAINPRLLRFIIRREHDTLANLKRDSRVMVSLICPPNLAVSVRGRARVVEEPFSADEQYALVEIDISEVKNDMALGLDIETGITIAPTGPFTEWWNTLWEKLQ